MNHSPDTEGMPQSSATAGSDPAMPDDWKSALANLIGSRIALFQLEAREAARHGAMSALRLGAAVLCVFFGWSLLLAGAVAAISAAGGWSWSWVAIAAAVIHLIGAAILFAVSRKSRPVFPHTRAEFQKDRQWFETLKSDRKSRN